MSRLFHITLIVLTVLGVPILLFFTFSNFLVSGIAAGVGMVFAVVYTAFWLVVLRVNAAWPRAGFWWVIASMLWGAGVSFLVVMIAGLPVLELMDKLGWTFVTASFGGAYPEEIVKALGVAVILLSFRRLNRPWHGFLTGALIGLGFEVVENLLYGTFGALMNPNSDLAGVLGIWALRVVAGPGLHVIFTALAGWGIGLALFRAGRSLSWRWTVAVAWTLLAFALHFAWNLMWESTTAQVIAMVVIALIMYPVAIWLYVHCHRSARNDGSQVVLPGLLTNLTALQHYRDRHSSPLPANRTEPGEPEAFSAVEDPERLRG
ncbi:PrsW family intramembrane metalloprotease [Corynebacterium halotolerans]|uniref:PrsW family intramembrane metalloprotease n=1 Tax=Corynebacterium halotolerans TaxID=225326 RepID=UPI003CE96D29